MSIENNLFSGIIPAELGNLVNLEDLILSANYLTGELPKALTNLTKLMELTISSNNFTGRIPDFFQSWKQLQKLDLSFNRLEGKVPDFEGLAYLQSMFLTSNLLNGPIPVWIKNRDSSYQIDLSYSNFLESSAPPTCRETLNLFESFSGKNNLTLGGKCLLTYPCSKELYSLHINCGGSATTIGNIEYEGEQNQAGPAKFVPNTANWGFSSSGNFWDVNSTSDQYIANNVSILRMNNSELFTSAWLSPLSLTYYARCLANGNYIVKLYFAEIVFKDNRSFYSLGRRIFDVYIQEKLELKDFDIENVAQGVDKVVVQEFKAIVRNKVLQIRFHWAGKGTTAAPVRGTYGPLISAISIESERRGLDLQTGFFTYRQIKAATDNFDAANKIGEGGFGSVYKVQRNTD